MLTSIKNVIYFYWLPAILIADLPVTRVAGATGRTAATAGRTAATAGRTAAAARRTAAAARVLAGAEDTRDGGVDARRGTATDLVNVVGYAEDGALRDTLHATERIRGQVDHEVESRARDVLQHVHALTDGAIQR